MMILMMRSGLEGPSHLAGYSQTSTLTQFLVPRVKGGGEDESQSVFLCVCVCHHPALHYLLLLLLLDSCQQWSFWGAFQTPHYVVTAETKHGQSDSCYCWLSYTGSFNAPQQELLCVIRNLSVFTSKGYKLTAAAVT